MTDVLYRILIPTFHAGSIIGKQGSIIGTVRQETGARIHITPSGHVNIGSYLTAWLQFISSLCLQGVEERVISIFCSANGPEEWSQADDALMRLLELSNGIVSELVMQSFVENVVQYGDFLLLFKYIFTEML